MENAQLQFVAQQLRKPEGEQGVTFGGMMNEGNRIINESALEKLVPKAGDSILELGMGNGYFIKDIVSKDKSIRYTGCDHSETMIAEAVKINAEWVDAGQVQFYHATADELPLDNDSFNKVFGVNIIYFWEHPETELAEIRRVLKTGGTLIIAIRPKSAMIKMPFTKYGFAMYSKEELVALLEKNSFTVFDILEKKEPAQEVNGETIYPETLVVSARVSK